jgi:hypothetical protein
MDWRSELPDRRIEHLEDVYKDYISYMTSRDLDPLKDVPEIPEHKPPPD